MFGCQTTTMKNPTRPELTDLSSKIKPLEGCRDTYELQLRAI